MKHLKRIFESEEEFDVLKQELEELKEVFIPLSDYTYSKEDDLEIKPNGEVNGFRNYNIDISVNYGKTDITKITETSEKFIEVIKKYSEIVNRLERMGYKVSYHLLQTTIHLEFSRLNGKIQLKKEI